MKRSMVFVLFFICAPVLLTVRVIQQLYMIDPLTGFYQDGFIGIGTIITVLCFALIAVTIAIVWLSRPHVPTPPTKSVPLGISALFVSICLFISATGNIMANTRNDNIIGVLAIIAAGSLAYYGASLLFGFKYPSLLTLAPIIYSCVRLVLDFMRYTGEVTVTDSVFAITTMGLVLLFFYSSGKLIAGVARIRSHILFYSYGLVAAFFCIDSVFTRLIIAITGSDYPLHGGSKIDLFFIGMTVYIIVSVLTFSAQPTADSLESAE